NRRSLPLADATQARRLGRSSGRRTSPARLPVSRRRSVQGLGLGLNDRPSSTRNAHDNLLLHMRQKVDMGILCNVKVNTPAPLPEVASFGSDRKSHTSE